MGRNGGKIAWRKLRGQLQSHPLSCRTNTLSYNMATDKHTFDAVAGQIHPVQQEILARREGIYLEDRDFAHIGVTTGRNIPGEFMTSTPFHRLLRLTTRMTKVPALCRYDVTVRRSLSQQPVRYLPRFPQDGESTKKSS